jgi:hypothetical protein
MKRVWVPIAAALSVFSGIGCSERHWPLLDDDAVVFTVYGSDDPIEIDGDEFLASTDLCLQKVDYGWPCGPRLVPEGYDEDSFVIDQDELGSFEVECVEDGDIYDGIKVADCGGLAQKADEGMVFRGSVNGSLVATVTMPARTRPLSPKNGSVISVSSVDGIPVSWTPEDAGDELRWGLHETFRIEGPCGEGVVWAEESFGELEDTGSFTIPKELLPTNLPPEGCSTDIVLTRTRKGRVEPIIKDELVQGRQFGFVEVILKP